MKLICKPFFFIAMLSVLFVGLLPAESLLCMDQGGGFKIELGSNGSCSCISSLEQHQQHLDCDESDCESMKYISKDCTDIEISSLASYNQQHTFFTPAVYMLALGNAFFTRTELHVQVSKAKYRSTKPSLPPPHLKILAATQLII